MRIVYFGTPAAAVPPLHALDQAGHDVVLVVTQPDRRRGRGGGLLPSEVKAAALDRGLEVMTPARAGEVVDAVRAARADLGVVVAFGQLLPGPLLEATVSGFVNMHFSLLPRWRGAAPVERALLAGDRETGVCIMEVAIGLDEGAVYARRAVEIDGDETSGDLMARLTALGTDLLVETIPGVPTATPEPQVGEPVYAHKLTVAEFEIDWSRPADEIERLVRAGNPRPGAWTWADGRRLKIVRARALEGLDAGPEGVGGPGCLLPGGHVATGAGVLRFVEVQAEGKGVVSGDAWAAGHRGSALGRSTPDAGASGGHR